MINRRPFRLVSIGWLITDVSITDVSATQCRQPIGMPARKCYILTSPVPTNIKVGRYIEWRQLPSVSFCGRVGGLLPVGCAAAVVELEGEEAKGFSG